jgi:hypothetical protein
MEMIKMFKIFIGIESIRRMKTGDRTERSENEVVVSERFVKELEEDLDERIITIGDLRFKQVK